MTIESQLGNDQKTDQRSNTKNDFWHLEDIKQVELETDSKIISNSSNSAKSLVGIIDTGCDTRHPCLQRCAIEEIDFAAFEQGGTYSETPDGPEPIKSVDLRRGLELLEIDIENDANGPQAIINRIINDFANRDLMTCHHTIENPAHRYGHHGVACAGLIAAHDPDNSTLKQFEIPIENIGFRGVQPECNLLCISTSFGCDVKPIIRALLYCVYRNVDAILIPRGIDRHDEDSKLSIADIEKSIQGTLSADISNGRIASASDEVRKDELLALDWLLENISRYFPVIVASGNSGSVSPEYPAVPEWADMIIVGSHNKNGDRSSYTSGRAQTLTLTAPGDDEETHFVDSLKLFDSRAVNTLRNSNLAVELPTQIHTSSIVSLDTVSQYKPRMTDNAIYGDVTVSDDINRRPLTDDPSRGYQIFGGTSAASAIVAGAVAQLQSASRYSRGERLSVKQVRHLLTLDSSSTTGAPRLNLRMAHDELPNIPPAGSGTAKTSNSIPA